MRTELVLASTSPQRRAILEQLRIPFVAVAPRYDEHDPPDADPVTLVREHALGKARSVHEAGRITLGVDTTVHLGQRVYAKPSGEDDARAMLRELAGRTHAVALGRLPAHGRRRGGRARGDPRHLLRARRRRHSTATSGAASGRAAPAGYAIQGLGGRLVERIDGDYLNVVGLPGALLVRLLEVRCPRLLL